MMTYANGADQEAKPQRIIASEITIVDRSGRPRIRLAVDDDGTAAVKFYDSADHLRVALFLKQPENEDEDSLFMSEDGELGLLMVDRRSGGIRLTIAEDGILGKRARLEISESLLDKRRTHRFPPRPAVMND
jgi:hypothetical protein